MYAVPIESEVNDRSCWSEICVGECTQPEREDQPGNDDEVPFKLSGFGLLRFVRYKIIGKSTKLRTSFAAALHSVKWLCRASPGLYFCSTPQAC